MPPSVTDILRISSGLRIPNWTRLTNRMVALESEPKVPISEVMTLLKMKDDTNSSSVLCILA